MTIRLGQFTLTESYKLNTAFGVTFDLDVNVEHIASAERLALHELKNMWAAAFCGEVAFKEVAANAFMSAVFLRLARAGLIEADSELSCVQLKESNANSSEQSAVAAY